MTSGRASQIFGLQHPGFMLGLVTGPAYPHPVAVFGEIASRDSAVFLLETGVSGRFYPIGEPFNGIYVPPPPGFGGSHHRQHSGLLGQIIFQPPQLPQAAPLPVIGGYVTDERQSYKYDFARRPH